MWRVCGLGQGLPYITCLCCVQKCRLTVLVVWCQGLSLIHTNSPPHSEQPPHRSGQLHFTAHVLGLPEHHALQTIFGQSDEGVCMKEKEFWVTKETMFVPSSCSSRFGGVIGDWVETFFGGSAYAKQEFRGHLMLATTVCGECVAFTHRACSNT